MRRLLSADDILLLLAYVYSLVGESYDVSLEEEAALKVSIIVVMIGRFHNTNCHCIVDKGSVEATLVPAHDVWTVL